MGFFDFDPKDASPEDICPEDIYPEDAYPEDACQEDIYPEDAYPEDAYPEDTYPEDVYPNADYTKCDHGGIVAEYPGFRDLDCFSSDFAAEDGGYNGHDVEGLAGGCDELSDEDMRRLGITPQPFSALEPIGSNRRAKRLTALVERVVASGDLLLTDGLAFTYQTEQGCFRPVRNLDRWLAEFFGPEIMADLLSRDLTEIVNRLSWVPSICCSADDLNTHAELINLSNGTLDVETGRLLPHDKEFRFTYTVQAAWLDEVIPASCPAFDQFCRSSLDSDPAKRQLLLEFIGYILLDNNGGKCALFLQGQPSSGKSVIVEFISRLFWPELVSHIPLHQLEDRFFRAELAGRKLNDAGEIAGRALADISIFKAVTGNDQIAGEFKGQTPFYFRLRCKLLFAGNTLPTTTETDTTDAFLNRIRVLLFNHSVAPEDQDKGLPDKLWEERDVVVTLALQAVQKLVQRNFEFTLPDDSRQFLDSFALRGNAVSAFVEECCTLDAEARVFNVELYAAFERFSKRNGLKVLSRTKFYELLSGLPHVAAKRLRIGSENRQGHVGIALKESH